MRLFFFDLHPENLGFLKVKLMRVWGPPNTESPRVLNSQASPLLTFSNESTILLCCHLMLAQGKFLVSIISDSLYSYLFLNSEGSILSSDFNSLNLRRIVAFQLVPLASCCEDFSFLTCLSRN